jgi:uncharacterized protein (TIGR03067 family)
MKATMSILGTAVAVCLLSAAGAAIRGDDAGDGARGELARLKGTWIRVLDGRTYVVNFDGDKFAEIFEFPGGTSTTSGTITIDPTSKPRHMDWKFTAGTGRGENLKGKTALTIYELDGDTFKFLATKQVSRPEKFPDREGTFPDKEGGDGYIYLVFKRVK